METNPTPQYQRQRRSERFQKSAEPPQSPAPRPIQLPPRSDQLEQPWQMPTTPQAAPAPVSPRPYAQYAPTPQQRPYAQRMMADTTPAPVSAEVNAGKEAAQRFPTWLSTALVLTFLLVLALIAGNILMRAYLVNREREWQAAYEATLERYHVVQDAETGGMHVTWQDTVERYAAEYNLRPAFVAAVIRNESSFRTDAESSAGARGLMQLMPATAEWIAGKLNDSAYSFDRMYDAETNIRYGCWYLGYLSKLFRGDAVLVSAAYHAGQTQVTRWLSDPSISSDGVTLPLEKLPDGPTKQYAGRVTTAYGIYQALLYPLDAPGAVPGSSADAGVFAANR